ncbi:uncharacterized protein LOC141649982 [Silene latifolia]|uniref:uncharacterized protein LOC141649982 n=1 Tax=Silene latifolia TaxID=37657 RepID=UPI003D782542
MSVSPRYYCETRYTSLEKLVLALVTASYKLRPYFESHTISVVTNYPLKTIMRKPELSGRMTKWSIHLSGYDLKFEPRTAIKSQALADFVSDFSPSLQMRAEKEILTLEEDKGEQVWELNVDGASNMKGAGVGLVLKSPQGDLLVQAVRCEFKATNNEAEYEALILGLQLALDLKIRHLQVYSDSQLIVNHVNNSYAARDPTMMAYLEIAQALKLRFQTFNIKQIPRDQNVEADALAALGVTFKAGTVTTVPIVHVLEPAISKAEQDNEGTAGSPKSQEEGVLANTTGQEEAVDWRKPYQDWLQNDTLPADKKEVRSFKMRASRFVLIDGVLFRKSHAGPYLRCLDKEEAQAVLHAIHSGECGNHAGGRSLSNKALRQGYFWPTMRKDAMEYAKKCDACQRHAPIDHPPLREPSHPSYFPLALYEMGYGYSRTATQGTRKQGLYARHDGLLLQMDRGRIILSGYRGPGDIFY